jgi:hypothetical protein
MAFFGANDVGLNSLAGDAICIGKLTRVEQRDQTVESVGLALVGCGRKQQEVGCRFRQPLPQPETCHLVGASAQPVGLVNDNQIPAR